MKNGGFGLLQLEPFNRTLLAKQFWRVISNPNNLMDQVIFCNYGKGISKYIDNFHFNGSWRWTDI